MAVLLAAALKLVTTGDIHGDKKQPYAQWHWAYSARCAQKSFHSICFQAIKLHCAKMQLMNGQLNVRMRFRGEVCWPKRRWLISAMELKIWSQDNVSLVHRHVVFESKANTLYGALSLNVRSHYIGVRLRQVAFCKQAITTAFTMYVRDSHKWSIDLRIVSFCSS